jgi:hypothetical protein
MGETGWPDRVFLYCGQAVFIEFKAPGKRARPLQEHRIKQLQDCGFKVGVYDDIDDAIGFLEASLLPSGGGKVNDQPSLRGAADGPRVR